MGTNKPEMYNKYISQSIIQKVLLIAIHFERFSDRFESPTSHEISVCAEMLPQEIRGEQAVAKADYAQVIGAKYTTRQNKDKYNIYI